MNVIRDGWQPLAVLVASNQVLQTCLSPPACQLEWCELLVLVVLGSALPGAVVPIQVYVTSGDCRYCSTLKLLPVAAWIQLEPGFFRSWYLACPVTASNIELQMDSSYCFSNTGTTCSGLLVGTAVMTAGS